MTLKPTSFSVDFTTTDMYGDNNSTNGSACPDDDWDWLNNKLTGYIVIVIVLGILGNVFVLLVFCLHKKACTVAEIYLSNLAAADLVLVSCLPFWAVNAANGFDWPFGLFMCRLVNLGIKMNFFCSIYFLVLVSIDRYVALVHTMTHGRMRSPKYAKLGCFLVWSFGLLLGLPTVIFRTLEYLPNFQVSTCYLKYPSMTIELAFDGMLTIFGFIIPVSIISYCTIKIIQSLKNHSAERSSVENTERKATFLVLVVLVAFLICWLPFHLVTTLDIFVRAKVLTGCRLSSTLGLLIQMFGYLGFFNSVLNPILYVIVGKSFRMKVRELFNRVPPKRLVTSDSARSHLSFSTLKTLASNSY